MNPNMSQRKDAFGERSNTRAGASDVILPPSPPPQPSGEPPPPVRWSYRWEDDSSVQETVDEPHLCDRLVEEVVRASSTSSHALIFVRGELGIGKSTLTPLLHEALSVQAEALQDARSTKIRTCTVMEAQDLETPAAFAQRIGRLAGTRSVIALARPATLDAAAGLLADYSPTATVTMQSFEPGTTLFEECIRGVAVRHELNFSRMGDLRRLTESMPSFLQTPFYYGMLADALKGGAVEGPDAAKSPLDLFRLSLERRIGTRAFSRLLARALVPSIPSLRPSDVIEGILVNDQFIHDGYRTVVLAAALLAGDTTIDNVARTSNAIPAVRLALDHISHSVEQGNDAGSRIRPLVSQIAAFASSVSGREDIPNLIYVQSLAAQTLSRSGINDPAASVQKLCMDLIQERQTHEIYGDPMRQNAALESLGTLWWDISDALALLGDPRLMECSDKSFAPNSGYFTHVNEQVCSIGSEQEPPRADMAKPVVCYSPQEVSIGSLWVANYLVSNDLFLSFWNDPERASFFAATGAQWINRDPATMEHIENMFDVASKRNFWKESRESHSFGQAGIGPGAQSLIDVARNRALRQSQVAIWNPAEADDRYSSPGSPVVGVNWWEAQAFCVWWQKRILPTSRFPSGARVGLLTDWEWEALRRIYYEGSTPHARERVEARLLPAHLRHQVDPRAKTNISRPLHVGLFPVPSGAGPTDMIGNVWEWTRSAVLGSIVLSESDDPEFGPTYWEDGDRELEKTAQFNSRDTIDQRDDLRYRAVRGSSYFAIDKETAWNPAYRLCDPPFASYPDLGFRIAVYPPRQT